MYEIYKIKIISNNYICNHDNDEQRFLRAKDEVISSKYMLTLSLIG